MCKVRCFMFATAKKQSFNRWIAEERKLNSELNQRSTWKIDQRSFLPRKEVIQPQLPLRLPCYDLVPITSPTLGNCLPCGLAYRLQVLPAFMT